MFCWFLCLVSSLTITDTSFQQYATKDESLVIFFSDPKCSDCEKMNSIISNISRTDISKKVKFASVNCVDSPKTCNHFDQGSNAQLVFYNGKHDKSAKLTGTFDDKLILEFINRQLHFPLIFIDNENEIDKSSFGASFLLTYKDLESGKIERLRKAAAEIHSSDSKFYAIKGKKWKLVSYRSKDSYAFFDGDWGQEELNKFVRQNFFPFVMELDNRAISQLKKFHKMTLTAFIDADRYLHDLRNVAQELITDHPFTYVIYSENNFLARFVGVQKSKIPQVILYDVENQRWLLYDGEMTDTGLKKWLESINLANAHWNGSSGGIKNVIVSIWTRRGFLFYLICALLLAGLGFLGKIVFDMLPKKPVNRRDAKGFDELKHV